MNDSAPPPLPLPTTDTTETVPGGEPPPSDPNGGPPLPLPPVGDRTDVGYQGGKDFFVDRQALTGLTDLLDRTADEAKDTHAFVVEHTTFDGGDGWIGELSESHPRIVEQVTGWLKRLHDPTTTLTADGVRATVAHYARSDDANAASLDATIPARDVSLSQVPRSLEEDIGLSRPIFAQVADPRSRLVPPPDYANTPAYKWQPTFWDVLSPSSHIRNAVIEVTKFLTWIGWMDGEIDPFDAWTKPVVGDWAGFRASADAFSAAAHACEDMAFNIDRSRHLLEPVWRGRAADACVTHLGEVRRAMYDARRPFNELGEAYKLAADGAAEYRKVVDGVIGELSDLAIALGVTVAAAGGAAGPSGGASLILGGVLGIWPVYRFITLCHEVNAARKVAQGIKDTAKGRINNALADADVVLPPLPSVGADSPLGQLPE